MPDSSRVPPHVRPAARRAAEGASPPLERDIALVELRRLLGERELAAGRLNMALDRSEAGARPPAGRAVGAGRLAGGRRPRKPDSGGHAPGRAALRRSRGRRAGGARAARTRRPCRRGSRRSASSAPTCGWTRVFPSSGSAPRRARGVHGVSHYWPAVFACRSRSSIADRATLAAQRASALPASGCAPRGSRWRPRAEVAAARVRTRRPRARGLLGRDPGAGAAQPRSRPRDLSLGRATLFDVLNEQRRFLEFEADTPRRWPKCCGADRPSPGDGRTPVTINSASGRSARRRCSPPARRRCTSWRPVRAERQRGSRRRRNRRRRPRPGRSRLAAA